MRLWSRLYRWQIFFEDGGMQLPEVVNDSASAISWRQSSTHSYAFLTSAGSNCYLHFASTTLKGIYARMLNWRIYCTMALTEPQMRAHHSDITTSAVKQTMELSVKGSKNILIWRWHELSRNIVHLVIAKSRGPTGVKGYLLLVVPKLSNLIRMANHQIADVQLQDCCNKQL